MARNLKSAEDKAVAERISSNIKELMILRGYRQVDLVDRTGIKRSTMSDYINGNTIVPTQAIKRIAKAPERLRHKYLGMKFISLNSIMYMTL